MWECQSVTTLQASKTCYRENCFYIFLNNYVTNLRHSCLVAHAVFRVKKKKEKSRYTCFRMRICILQGKIPSTCFGMSSEAADMDKSGSGCLPLKEDTE
jgi:hypothetical protein